MIRETRPKQGFALLLVLGFMGVMLILLLGLSTIVQVEFLNAKNSAEIREARSNALLGLTVAMGELQKYMGPDARVSTRMDFYQDDAPDASEVVAPTNRWLTAVWDCSKLTATGRPAGLPRVLISGNDQAAFDPMSWSYPNGYLNPVSAELPDPEVDDGYVWLHRDRRPETQRQFDGSIKAPVERGRITGTDGQGEGGFAWVVLDEGVKAKVNGRYSYSEVERQRSGQTNGAVLQAERLAPEMIDGMEHLTFASPEWTELQRAVDLSDLDFLTSGSGSPDLSQVNFHTTTFDSAGVLAKTTYDRDTLRWGGLKRDLTNGLRAEGIDEQLEGRAIFPAATDIAGDAGGPLWDQLYSWVNSRPKFYGKDLTAVYDATVADGAQAGISPLLTLAQISLSIVVLPEPTSAGEYAVWYYFQPSFVLWNPYDAAIAGDQWYVDMKLSDDPAETLPWKYQIIYNQNGARKRHPQPSSGTDYDGMGDSGLTTPAYARIPFLLDLGRDLQAGEAVVFSPSAPVETVTDGTSGWRLAPGYRGGYAFAYRVPNSEFTLEDGDEIVSKVAGFGVVLDEDEKNIPGDIRLADSITNLENQPLLYISGLNYGGGDDFAPVNNGEIHVSGMPIPDTKPNFAIMSGLKFAQSRLEQSVSSRVQWLGYLDPTASFSGRTPSESRANDARSGFNNNPSWESGYYEEPTVGHVSVPCDGNTAYVGFTDAATSNNTSAILFHLPRDPLEMRSIGDLMHARLTVAHNLDDAVNYWKWSNTSPAYAVGNGIATPYVNYDETYNIHSVNAEAPSSADVPEMVSYDMSWNLNSALWDDYFFSAIPTIYERSDFPALTPMVSKNSRIFSISGEESDALDSMTLAASDLLVDGAFNVNSTSVDAWEALLGAFLGANVDISAGSEYDNQGKAPWLRLPYPQNTDVDASDSLLPERSATYSGFRALAKDEIHALAEAVVEQVKLRGPFVSMADFVNRSVQYPAVEHAVHHKAALQTAIEAAGLNDSFYSATSNLYSADEDLYQGEQFSYGYYRKAMEGSFSANAPGFLSQADILSKIGSVLTVRSDTFKIRVYGETESSITGARVKAWCEAIVQRMPEKVDSTEVVTAGDPVGGFGRRFVIKHFRWLQPEEI
ncbi:hypothetical protein [Coraliomargarita parva]|uniref:hypothetical protein n=1 Tax=Coraliomargarita parva TaxID=3014050 RepID=UPI0022B56B1A|nr:hypothetical protein [Coraliomargarita parva]